MSQPIHTLGKGCDFAPPSSSEQALKPCEEMPPMRAQFFYCSPLPLDDPLTSLPPPTADSKHIKYPPRPFPKCDNQALLQAWLGMGSRRDRRSHNRTCKPKVGIEPAADKKFGIIGLKPKVKEVKEAVKAVIPNPENCQSTTQLQQAGPETANGQQHCQSTTQMQQTNSETANAHQEHATPEKSGKNLLEMVGCPCKGSHRWCRKKTGKCICAYCPKASPEALALIQDNQPQSLEQTDKKQSAAESITKSKSKEDLQGDKTDQIKRSKHLDHNCRRGKSMRAKSGKDSKIEEDPEFECSCNQPPEDLDRRAGKLEESKPTYGRPVEPLSTETLQTKSSKHKREKSEERKPDNLQPECLCTEEELQQDKNEQVKRSKHYDHNCRIGRSERERVEKERVEKERSEKERVEKERSEKERVEKESPEKELKPEEYPQPECLCTEEELQRDNAEQSKRSKHWEHNCRRGRSERARSKKELEPQDTTGTEHPKETKPVKAKSKNKGKGKAIAIEEQDEQAQPEETEAWFDQQLRAQMEPTSTTFCKDQRHGTEDTEDSVAYKDENDDCCVGLEYRGKLNDMILPGSRIPSCCDDSKIGKPSKRQQSEAETIFPGSCDESNVDTIFKRQQSEVDSVFSGICEQNEVDNSSKRQQSEADSVFSGSCDQSKVESSSKRKESEADTTFSGSCDTSKVDDFHNRKESEAETIFSGSCNKNNADTFTETKVSTRLPSCCDESKVVGSSQQEGFESVTRFGSCCDDPKPNNKQNPERPSESEQDATDAIHDSCYNKQSQHSSGVSVQKATCNDNHTEQPTKPSTHKPHSHHQHSSGLSANKPACNDNQVEHPTKPSAHKAHSHRHRVQQSSGSHAPHAHAHTHTITASNNQSKNSSEIQSNNCFVPAATRPSAQKSHSHHKQAQHPTESTVHIHTTKSNDNQLKHSTRPSAHKSHSHNRQVQQSAGPVVHIHESRSNDNETQHCSRTTKTIHKSKSKNSLLGRRQADGSVDQDGGLSDDSEEELSDSHMLPDQGDATNDKCTCEPLKEKSEHSVLTAGNGNMYTKVVQTTRSGTTGKPFVKLPARGENPVSQDHPTYEGEAPLVPQISHDRDLTEDMEVEGCKAYKHREHTRCQVEVPVGTCRLHLVNLPNLIVTPIYWSPLNDQYPCIYGTWFYKDTMCPVEPAVANQLEKGYRENECWSQTWDDQLNSAIEVGPEGEEKIAHRLWPLDSELRTLAYDPSEHILSTDPHCAARCFHGEAAAEGKIEEPDTKKTAATSISKKYPNSQVIYKNCEEAFILKPSLSPSAYYGRRPLAKIKSGFCVGVPVVRGFDRKAWNKLNPSKRSTTVTKAQTKTAKHNTPGCNILEGCPACKAQDERENVTDLCLVIHGIGQKLSERMESFNFTYAVNSFRCEMKRELCNEDVKKVLREDFCGVTTLPVNWRANLSFEDGGPRKPGDKDRTGCDFALGDITQPTIPRVRELISDVMLDIPYYMSGHKHKMIAALIIEANRIYRLWCKNNPGFHKNGRVHIVSHSLGSVMALEVLSKQPTTSPAELSWRPNTKYFDFQTTNCFLAGSPCAFFLLLENKSLVPRKGIHKPGCDCENGSSKDIFGDVGTFGCLAVDNIYNIMHCNDPIAYRLNACVDSRYAAGLKQAEVPDSSRSFMTAVTHAMKSAAGMSQNEEVPVGEMPRPATITKMPSQMEMEVHDFTAEEMAEKKFCQLNENGQIDWILGSRPSMLANQYIDMLSAHSSYWNNKDFIRFLCVEIGRKSGKCNTLPNMRARKSQKSRK